MQVNTVSLLNNKVVDNSSFGHNSYQERFADLNDRQIRKIAYVKTSKEVGDKKHRRIDNAIIYSIPVVAGISAAVSGSASRIGRLARFGVGFASWAVPFAIVDGVFRAKHVADKKLPSVKEFSDKHPFAAFAGTIAASIAGYVLFRKGALKGLDKYGENLAKNIKPYIDKTAKALNSSKMLDKVSSLTKKVPSSIKELSKSALDWAPWLLIFTSIGHNMAHDKVKSNEYLKNYNELKKAQAILRDNLKEPHAQSIIVNNEL